MDTMFKVALRNDERRRRDRRSGGDPWGMAPLRARPAPVEVLDRPDAMAVVKLPEPPDLSEYEAIASKLGFEPAQLKAAKQELARRELLEHCLDNGYPIYETVKVEAFMSSLARSKGKEFFWNPLTSYAHPIPVHILRRAADIKQRFPDVEFQVSDYRVRDPDPFIAASRQGCALVVFGVWDEPSFGDIKKRDREQR